MKALLLTITILFGSIYFAAAQQQDSTKRKPDVLVLTDGSILKGERIEATKPGQVRLRMADGTEVEFPVESVAQIRTDVPSNKQPRKPHQVQTKGLYAVVTAGLLFGDIDQDPISFTSGAAIGYRFLPQLYLAGGAGTDMHGSSGNIFAPVFLRIGGEAMKTKVTPSYFFSGGYALPFEEESEQYFDIKGGPFYEGGVGATFRTSGRIYWSLSITYRHYKGQRSYQNQWWWGTDDSYVTEKRTYRRFGLNVGMCF